MQYGIPEYSMCVHIDQSPGALPLQSLWCCVHREQSLLHKLADLKADHAAAVVQLQQHQESLHYLDRELAAREAERDSWCQRAEAAEGAYHAELERSRLQQQRHAGDLQQLKEDRQAALEEQQALLDALQSRDQQVRLIGAASTLTGR